MRFCTLAILSLSLAAGAARAQVFVVTSGDYNIITHAEAYTVVDDDSANGNVAADNYSRFAEAYAEYDDPNLGLHTAQGNAGLLWETSTVGAVTTLHGGVGGVAQAVSNGLDTYAIGAASVAIYFDVLTDSVATLDSQGTYDSQLYVFSQGGWQQLVSLLGTWEDFDLPTGSYRWNAAAGESVSGYSYYSSGIEFSVSAQAVPEPGTLAAVGLGGIALLLRRRRR